MCEVDLEDARDGLVRLDRSASGPEDGDVDGAVVREVVSGSDCVVREVGSGSAPVDGLVRLDRQGSAPEVRAVRAGRPDAGRGPNRAGRRVQA